MHTKKKKYLGKVEIEDWVEYALGSCSSSKTSTLTERYLKPRFKKSSYNKLKSLSKSSKKMLILLISVDSFSRRHFYRKLKETVKFLQEIPEFEVVDFKLHNIVGTDTAGNQFFLFGPLGQKGSGPEKDVLGDSALWKIMKKNKFMTLWGTDGCSSNVPKALGSSPEVDHVVATFFCANRLYSRYSPEKFHTFEQRCMGSRMSHSYLMNYTQEFCLQYQEVDLWVYNHFTAGHEASGQHAQSIDVDLKDYLKWFVEKFGESHNLVVFLNGDHGMRYGEHMSKTKSIQEYRLPASFILGHRSFLSQVSNISTLQTNSWRLNSKPDLRQTMIYLAEWQSGLNQSSPDHNPSNIKVLNLFQDLIPSTRTCDNAGIPPWFCSYIILNPVQADHSLFDSKLIFNVLNSVLEMVNSEILAKTFKMKKMVKICNVSLVESAKVPFIEDEEWVGRLAGQCLQPKVKIFNFWVFFARKRRFDENVLKSEFFPSFPVLLGMKRFFCKVVHFSWIDVV
jgi:hypothetical protein